MDQAPPYLYKIVAREIWEESHGKRNLALSKNDELFIHLSTDDQLAGIIKKYWSNKTDFMVLKIDTTRLIGRMVHESNPGGTNKYYHLYEGRIPLDSIVEVKTIKP